MPPATKRRPSTNEYDANPDQSPEAYRKRYKDSCVAQRRFRADANGKRAANAPSKHSGLIQQRVQQDENLFVAPKAVGPTAKATERPEYVGRHISAGRRETAARTQSPLFRLPYELRMGIYSLVLQDNPEALLEQLFSKSSFIYTCLQIRDEIWPASWAYLRRQPAPRVLPPQVLRNVFFASQSRVTYFPRSLKHAENAARYCEQHIPDAFVIFQLDTLLGVPVLAAKFYGRFGRFIRDS